MVNSFSICITTVNRPKLLARLLGHLLSDGNNDFEVVVAENSAEDDTRKVIESYSGRFTRFRAIHHEKRLSYAENLDSAIRAAQNRFVYAIADDDLPNLIAIRAAVAMMAAEAALVAVYGGYDCLDLDSGSPLPAVKFTEVARFFTWETRAEFALAFWTLEKPVLRAETYLRHVIIEPVTRIFGWSTLATFLRVGTVAMIPESLMEQSIHAERWTQKRAVDAEHNFEWIADVEQFLGVAGLDSGTNAMILRFAFGNINAFQARTVAGNNLPRFSRMFLARGLSQQPEGMALLSRQWEFQFLLPALADEISARIRRAGPVEEVLVEPNPIAAWLVPELERRLSQGCGQVKVLETERWELRKVNYLVYWSWPGNVPVTQSRQFTVIEDTLASLRLTTGDISIAPS